MRFATDARASQLAYKLRWDAVATLIMFASLVVLMSVFEWGEYLLPIFFYMYVPIAVCAIVVAVLQGVRASPMRWRVKVPILIGSVVHLVVLNAFVIAAFEFLSVELSPLGLAIIGTVIFIASWLLTFPPWMWRRRLKAANGTP